MYTCTSKTINLRNEYCHRTWPTLSNGYIHMEVVQLLYYIIVLMAYFSLAFPTSRYVYSLLWNAQAYVTSCVTREPLLCLGFIKHETRVASDMADQEREWCVWVFDPSEVGGLTWKGVYGVGGWRRVGGRRT